MHIAVGELARGFTAASGRDLDLDFGTVGGLQAKLDDGEIADVLVLSVSMIARMEEAGDLVPGTRRDVARTYIGVCVRDGAPPPAIGTVEAFEATLRAAPAIAFSAAGVGGSAGIYLAALFERMGLVAMMAEKGMPQQTGAEVARRVAEGQASIGLTLSGEIAGVPGVTIAGPLPSPIGSDTTYCAAVWTGSAAPDAGRAFIDALTNAGTRETWKKAGFELP